jgi:hypothetical protein
VNEDPYDNLFEGSLIGLLGAELGKGRQEGIMGAAEI